MSAPLSRLLLVLALGVVAAVTAFGAGPTRPDLRGPLDANGMPMEVAR